MAETEHPDRRTWATWSEAIDGAMEATSLGRPDQAQAWLALAAEVRLGIVVLR